MINWKVRLQNKTWLLAMLAAIVAFVYQVLALRIASWDDVQALADYQYMLTKPVCFVCDDTQLLEAALRAYQGRALYDGALPEDTLLPLCAKYGLLL